MDLLDGKLELVRHALEKARSERELETLPKQLEDSMVGHHGMAVVVLQPGGQILYSTADAKFPQELLAGVGGETHGPMQWTDPENRHYRGISAATPTGMAGTARSSWPCPPIWRTMIISCTRSARRVWTVMGLRRC